MNSDSDSALDQTVAAYADWLKVHAPQHLKPFENRRATQSEAAKAEAAAFGFLRLLTLNPAPAEDVSDGGVDFVCKPTPLAQLAIEVTSIQTKTVAKATGLPADPPTGGGFGFKQMTFGLLNEAVNKAKQLADQPFPRVLMILTRHPLGHLVMGVKAAEELLTGTQSFSVPIGTRGTLSFKLTARAQLQVAAVFI